MSIFAINIAIRKSYLYSPIPSPRYLATSGIKNISAAIFKGDFLEQKRFGIVLHLFNKCAGHVTPSEDKWPKSKKNCIGQDGASFIRTRSSTYVGYIIVRGSIIAQVEISLRSCHGKCPISVMQSLERLKFLMLEAHLIVHRIWRYHQAMLRKISTFQVRCPWIAFISTHQPALTVNLRWISWIHYAYILSPSCSEFQNGLLFKHLKNIAFYWAVYNCK